MGLLSRRYRFEGDPPSTAELLVRLRQAGHEAALTEHPEGFHLIIDNLNVPVLRRGTDLELVLRGLGRLTRGRWGRAGMVRRALMAIGGRPEEMEAPQGHALPHHRLLVRFERAPSIEEVTLAVARMQQSRVTSTSLYPNESRLRIGSREVSVQHDDGQWLELTAPLGADDSMQAVESVVKQLGGI